MVKTIYYMKHTTKRIGKAATWILYGRLLLTLVRILPQLRKTGWQGNPFRRLVHAYPAFKPFLFPRKVWSVNGKYHWGIFMPGYPSAAFRHVMTSEISKLAVQKKEHGLATLIFAITKKCALNCEHCFEWNDLNQPEQLEEADIRHILDGYFEAGGIGQVIFSGGEPLTRFPLLKRLVSSYKERCNLWIATSGLGLQAARAAALKTAGLTGVMISLDHHEPTGHDDFRGFGNSWHHAVEAVKHAQEAGLVTALSLCPAKGKVTPAFLREYLLLARELKVAYVQFIEPRSEGRYQHKPVELDPADKQLLEAFCNTYNKEKAYADFPLIAYPDLYRRKFGCTGGKSFAYVDTNGMSYPCPFCKQPGQSCLSEKKVQSC